MSLFMTKEGQEFNKKCLCLLIGNNVYYTVYIFVNFIFISVINFILIIVICYNILCRATNALISVRLDFNSNLLFIKYRNRFTFLCLYLFFIFTHLYLFLLLQLNNHLIKAKKIFLLNNCFSGIFL